MDSESFFIEFKYNNRTELAEIKPCCQQDNIYYYDVYMRNRFQFTVTPVHDNQLGLMWKIALKNADKQVETDLVTIIGEQIEKHFFDITS